MENFTKKFLSPLFAMVFIIALMIVYYIFCYAFSFKFGFFDIEESGATEIITYLFYGFSLGVAFCYIKDYINTSNQRVFLRLFSYGLPPFFVRWEYNTG